LNNNRLILKKGVLAVALTLAASQAAVLAQSTPLGAPAATVYITGSNLKRTQKEGTQPIQVITSKDIRDSGAATVTELMRKVPAMGSDVNLDTNDGGFARGVSTASLRGLSSTSTLVLLNGRRMTPSAYADPNDGNSTLYDLNSIPLSALERVEILKDGASAVYGSDAIGGVINFITKSNYQGLEIAARASANDDGNFARQGVNFFAGKGELDSDGYNVFLTADVSKRDRVVREDVKDIAFDLERTLNGRYATPYGSAISNSPSFYRETGPGTKVFSANRANMATRLITTLNCDASRQLTGSTAMGLAATSVFVGRTFCNYNTNQFLEGIGKGNDASVMSRGVMKLGARSKAFAELAYTRSERAYTGSPITIGQGVIQNFTSASVGTPFQAILEIGHPDNPFPAARASVGYRFENLRGGTEVTNASARLLTGLQGTLGGWDWETAYLYNRSTKDETYFGRLYLPTLRKLNTGTTLAQLAADPTLGRDVSNANQAAISQIDAKASTSFGQLGGGAIGLAMGAEARHETIELVPDAVLAAGNIYGLVNTIIDGKRNVTSAFVELRTPFLKNFEMDFAGRLDKYPGLKTNFVPKIGAKWTVAEALALRGTYARGFRAPALVQVTPGGAQFFQTRIFDPKRCEPDRVTPKPGAAAEDCIKSIAGTGGYNPDLVPEKAKSYSFGFLLSPAAFLDLSVDFYKIRKTGEVILGDTDGALKLEDRVPGNVLRDTNPANFLIDANGNPIPGTGPLLMVKNPWTNQGAVQVKGVDLDIAYRKNLGAWGQFGAKLSSTYTDSYRLAAKEGDTEYELAGGNAGITDWSLSSGLDIPKWKSSLSASLARGAHAFNASINYVGPVSMLRKYDKDEDGNGIAYAQPFCHFGTPQPTDAAPDRNAANPNYEAYFPQCAVKSWTTVGAGYTYTGFKNLSLNLNIQNLFDTKAPYDPNYSATAGAPLVGYNEGLHNPYGRYFSFTARYVF
jgi:iron complex outermembrane receptor protein